MHNSCHKYARSHQQPPRYRILPFISSSRRKWQNFFFFIWRSYIFFYVRLCYLHCKGFHTWKSKLLNPIYFVKIRLPDFLCNEFLLKMYRLLQITPSKYEPLSKITTTCFRYIFFTWRSLFTIDRKVDMWFRTHVRWFATVVSTVFIFIVDLYKYQLLKVYQQTF